MTWRLRIRHSTGFHYSSEVVSSYNEARLMPLSTPEQLVIDARVAVEPSVNTFRYWDYWGTLVHAFDVQVPHTELVVTGSSVVETSSPDARPAPAPIGWEELASREVQGTFAELVTATDYVPVDEGLQRTARELAAGKTPREACEAVGEWARSHLRYERGTTTVSTTAIDALHEGAGVCQDFAHVSLALFRAMGIPARYVSGYLHPSADAVPGQTTEGQSHAWVEVWLGEWVAMDPTSGQPVGERHVIVGRARDYADVSPLKGIYHGGPAEALAVTVELTRLS